MATHDIEAGEELLLFSVKVFFLSFLLSCVEPKSYPENE